MKKYTQLGFVLGRDSALSIAEIFAVLTRKNIGARTLHYEKDILIIELNAGISDISINELGGSIKIFEILGEYKDIADIKANLVAIIPFENEKRINFGISGYGKLNKKVVLNLGYEIKEQIVTSGYKARFVTGKNTDLSSVIVHENKLLTRGFEAILIRTPKTYILGRTLEVQDYKAYSRRDFGRPKRDDRNGMLPPKLAQIIINLAEKPENSIIYDPFCGSGTVLQEALLLGYRNVYGSDIAEQNIADTRENLEWLLSRHSSTEYKFGTGSGWNPEILKQVQYDVFVADVLDAGSLKLEASVDAIIGEGYLGEPNRRTKDEAVLDSEKLANFYLQALTNLAKQLTPDGRIVLAVPFFIVGTEYFYLPILEKIQQTGLQIVKPNLGDAELRLHGRGNLTYSRADQFVGREIIILEKQA